MKKTFSGNFIEVSASGFKKPRTTPGKAYLDESDVCYLQIGDDVIMGRFVQYNADVNQHHFQAKKGDFYFADLSGQKVEGVVSYAPLAAFNPVLDKAKVEVKPEPVSGDNSTQS